MDAKTSFDANRASPAPEMPIAVACSSDSRYLIPLAVMAASLTANLGQNASVDLYVVERGLTPENKAFVEDCRRDNRLTVRWITPDDSLMPPLPLLWGYSMAVYDPIRCFDFLPEAVSKVILMDVDMVVLDDLAELWNMEFDDRPLMAVRDSGILTVASNDGIAGYRELGLAADTPYFNSGLMVADRRRWAEADITQKALSYLRRNYRLIRHHDQEALNAVIGGRWTELHPRWNLPAWTLRPTPSYEKIIREAWARPGIVHYLGKLKPWENPSTPRADIFYRYLDLTPWRGFRPPISLGRRLRAGYEIKVRNKILPLEKTHASFLRRRALKQQGLDI